ncbi:MAG: hypothetical protein IPO19_06495 [Rhodoferax sp.]|nr:hypothetical protein [Rhodoferax sp.]
MKRFSLALLSVGSLSYFCAQAQPAGATTLAPVTVTGNPLGATDLIAPVTQYSGTELLLRTKTTRRRKRACPVVNCRSAPTHCGMRR